MISFHMLSLLLVVCPIAAAVVGVFVWYVNWPEKGKEPPTSEESRKGWELTKSDITIFLLSILCIILASVLVWLALSPGVCPALSAAPQLHAASPTCSCPYAAPVPWPQMQLQPRAAAAAATSHATAPSGSSVAERMLAAAVGSATSASAAAASCLGKVAAFFRAAANAAYAAFSAARPAPFGPEEPDYSYWAERYLRPQGSLRGTSSAAPQQVTAAPLLFHVLTYEATGKHYLSWQYQQGWVDQSAAAAAPGYEMAAMQRALAEVWAIRGQTPASAGHAAIREAQARYTAAALPKPKVERVVAAAPANTTCTLSERPWTPAAPAAAAPAAPAEEQLCTLAPFWEEAAEGPASSILAEMGDCTSVSSTACQRVHSTVAVAEATSQPAQAQKVSRVDHVLKVFTRTARTAGSTVRASARRVHSSVAWFSRTYQPLARLFASFTNQVDP